MAQRSSSARALLLLLSGLLMVASVKAGYRMWKNILLFLSFSGLVGHHASPITKLYHFVDQKMTWTDAQRHCREHFDDLATVDNPEELKELQESRIWSDYDTGRIWIGLYDDITRWQWSHGNQSYRVGQHYGNWRERQPNNGGGDQYCIRIETTDLLNDVPCNWEEYALCYDDEGNYVYVKEKMTWSKARDHCKSNYMDLASLRNATENGKIVAMVDSNAWIGLHRYPYSHWSDGSRATYTNWNTGEPNNIQNNGQCVYMNVTSGYYFDFKCGSLYGFACQEQQKQRSTFKLKISSEADMTDPEVQHQFVEQLSAKLAKEGVTGVKLRWVLKDGQDQQSQK